MSIDEHFIFYFLGKKVKILLCFSARENINELNKTDSNSDLNLMYGIRLVLMSTILTGHSLVNMLTGPVSNYELIEQVQNIKIWKCLSVQLTSFDSSNNQMLFIILLPMHCLVYQQINYLKNT